MGKEIVCLAGLFRSTHIFFALSKLNESLLPIPFVVRLEWGGLDYSELVSKKQKHADHKLVIVGEEQNRSEIRIPET